MGKVIREAEAHYAEHIGSKRPEPASKSRTFISDVICQSACITAAELDAKAIVGMTTSGYTAFRVSSYRPSSNIYIFSVKKDMLNTLNLVWGVRSFYYDKFTTTDETIQDVTAILKKEGVVKVGDIVINTGSMPLGRRYRTNMLKVTEVEE
jgi:pyruvate kinase